MLTIVNPLSIEGYTVYQDDQNDLDFAAQRIDALMGADRARFQSLEDALSGAVSSAPDRTKIPAPDQAPVSCRYYVLPKDITIAKDANGDPTFSLVVYRVDEDTLDPTAKSDVGGAILTFTAEMSVPDDKLQKITSKLRALIYGNDDSGQASQKQVFVSPVIFTGGTVSVVVGGDPVQATSDAHYFVKNGMGTGPITGVADNKKAVMVSLTQAGASLLWQLKDVKTLPILIQYDMEFEHRLLAVRLVVWCDVNSSYHLIQSTDHEVDHEHTGYLGVNHDANAIDKVTAAKEVMIRNNTAGVTVTPLSSSVDQDTITALQKFGEDMLQKQMEKVVEAKGLPDKLDRAWITEYDSDALNLFNFTLDQRLVLKQKYTPSANLSNVFAPPAQFDKFVTLIDLTTAFFKQLRVPIRVNADFSKHPVSHVVVTVDYRSKRPDGSGFEDATKSFDFTDGAQLQTFDCFANTLDTLTFDWKAEVHYKDSETPFTIVKKKVKDRLLVVDVGTMGLIDVNIKLGLVELDLFPRADVSVRYTSRATGNQTSRQFVLDKDDPEAQWTDIVLEESSGAYEVKVDWLRKSDGAILPGKWEPSTARDLVIDGPKQAKMTVTVAPVGSFKEAGATGDIIAAINVALRYQDPDNSYFADKVFTFSEKASAPQIWELDLRNAALQDYEYRYSIVYAGGLHHDVPADGSWLKGPAGYINVGEQYDMEVKLNPVLLKFTDKDAVVEVDLAYDDDEKNVHTRGTFVFSKDAPKATVWRTTTGGKGAQPYTMTITYYTSAGKTTTLPTENRDTPEIVIPPASGASP